LANENVNKELINKVAELRGQEVSQQKIANQLHLTRSKTRTILDKIKENRLVNVGEVGGETGGDPKPPFSPASPTSLSVSSPGSPAVGRKSPVKSRLG
jgi:hypothetical protein